MTYIIARILAICVLLGLIGAASFSIVGMKATVRKKVGERDAKKAKKNTHQKIEHLLQSEQKRKKEQTLAPSGKRHNLHDKEIVEVNKLLRAADGFLEKENYDEAEKALIAALSIHPIDMRVQSKLGLTYIKKQLFGKAEQMYARLVENAPYDAVFYTNLGYALYHQEKLEHAKFAYKRAIELDPSKPSRFISLGQIYYDLEHLEKAEKMFERAFEADAKNVDVMATLAHIAEKQENKEKARTWWYMILSVDPHHVAARDAIRRIESI